MILVLASFSCMSQVNSVITLAGNGSPGMVNGSYGTTQFNHPFGLCLAGDNGQPYPPLYVSDADNHVIRLLYQGGSSTLAGTGTAGYLDGPALQAKFNSPADICSDESNNIYICDFQNQRIRKLSFDGIVTTIAGTGVAGYQDGPGNIAKFNYPRGICRDNLGNLYVGDSWNHRIRKITPDGTVTTYAGGGTIMGVGSVGGYIDGADTSARFYTPTGLSIDENRNIFVADAYNHRIRRIDTNRIVTTVAGSGPSGNGQGGHANGTGFVARFNTPTELWVLEGPDWPKLFVSDTYNNRIRLIHLVPNGNEVLDFAGNGQAGFQNGTIWQDSAEFNFPRAIAGFGENSFCVLYIADYNNHAIRESSWMWSGIGEINNYKYQVSLFPNPTADFVHFEISPSNLPSIILEFYDICGNLIRLSTVINTDIIDLGSMSQGLYTIKVRHNDQIIAVKKLIKL
jgi:hypothetical protein